MTCTVILLNTTVEDSLFTHESYSVFAGLFLVLDQYSFAGGSSGFSCYWNTVSSLGSLPPMGGAKSSHQLPRPSRIPACGHSFGSVWSSKPDQFSQELATLMTARSCGHHWAEHTWLWHLLHWSVRCYHTLHSLSGSGGWGSCLAWEHRVQLSFPDYQ